MDFGFLWLFSWEKPMEKCCSSSKIAIFNEENDGQLVDLTDV